MALNDQLIDDFARRGSEDAMRRLVATVKDGKFDAGDLHRLAEAMAKSGGMIDFPPDTPTADLASTGGPGSLSTLLGPLYLRAYGFVVPKLGVPGRPAGGVDVLAQMPGYKVSLTQTDIRAVLARCGYVHFLAGGGFAPLDAGLFQYRQTVGAQNVPALAVASLLAKKITCGVKLAGLDVRVAPHGNFGDGFDDARASARLFCEAARVAGIKATAILTDARYPYQPYIGRGEALVALHLIFEGRADLWLAEHDDRCRLMAAQVASLAHKNRSDDAAAVLRTAFAENVAAQGSSVDAFEAKVAGVAKGHGRELKSPREGFVKLDIPVLRSAFVSAHLADVFSGDFPDRLGIILRVRPGAFVRRGDILATIRADDAAWAKSGRHLSEAFQVADLLDYAPGVEGIVRG